jgi:PhzF family phenazine biosynthesis protein
MATPTPIFQVDAFTNVAFAGNPAGVALLHAPAGESWMQAVGAEMNLAETAFCVRSGADDGSYDLRWFSPTVEIPLCGHATLATAHVLWTEGLDAHDVLTFETMSGTLRARRLDDGLIELDFPATDAVDAEVAPEVLDALGVSPVRTAATNNDWLLVEVATAPEVRAAAPDLVRLGAVTGHAAIITAPGDGRDGDADIVSRVFAPAAGIPEDPVTGSAHCILGPWWTSRVGKPVLIAEQASPRGGRLVVEHDAANGRVGLRGEAVTTLRGELLV